VKVPNREIVTIELEAFERTEMFPLALVEELGAKVTPKVKLCTGIREAQSADAVRCAGRGLGDGQAGAAGVSQGFWTGVWPESGTVNVGFDALLVMERLPPEADPPLVGAKVTLKVALCPAARVAGRLSPLTL
jgi:hypothetical protein